MEVIETNQGKSGSIKPKGLIKIIQDNKRPIRIIPDQFNSNNFHFDNIVPNRNNQDHFEV